MKRIYVNEKWCLGCHLCEYYCAFANSGESDMAVALRDVKINPRIRIVGCYTCIMACPYGAVMPSDDGSVIQKCELCLNNSTGSPACVKGCPNQAIVFEER